jgi:hypothetical protein
LARSIRAILDALTLAFLRSGIPLDDRLMTYYPAFTMKSRYSDTESPPRGGRSIE